MSGEQLMEYITSNPVPFVVIGVLIAAALAWKALKGILKVGVLVAVLITGVVGANHVGAIDVGQMKDNTIQAVQDKANEKLDALEDAAKVSIENGIEQTKVEVKQLFSNLNQ